MTFLAITLLTALVASALFTGYESAWFALNRIDIHGSRGGVRGAYDLLSRSQRVIYTSLFGTVVSSSAALISAYEIALGCAHKLQLPAVAYWVAAAVVGVLIPIHIVFCIVVPRRYFRRHPNSWMLQAAGPILMIAGAVLPIVGGVRRLVSRARRDTHAVSNLAGKLTTDDLRQLLEPTTKPGDVAAIDKRMIFGIFDLEQTIVREIMQPLVNIASLPRTEATRESIVRLARVSGYSRIPVYTNRIVNMDGVVDVLPLLRSPESTPLDSFIMAPYYVPETMRANKLLRKMIHDHVHLAIVVDEFGGTVGLVTQEDVLEEIVGEIEDEFDPARPTVLELPDGSFVVDGRMDIDDVNDRFGTDLPNEDYDRLGGFIYDEVGRIPRVGDVVERGKVRVEVMSMDGKQIERVRLSTAPQQPEPPEETEI